MKAEEAREGRIVILSGKPYKILGSKFGGAAMAGRVVHIKLCDVETGTITERTFHGNEQIEEATLEKQKMEYLYSDGENYHFMNTETYEQFPVPAAVVGNISKFLKENTEIQVEFFEGRPVNIVFPKVMELRVERCAPGIKEGSGTTFKEAVLENEMEVLVPQFINPGDIVKIETATGKYIDRVKR
jgi:elongation factor P